MIPLIDSKYTQVLELTRDVMKTSDVDFADLPIDEETSLQMIVCSVLDMVEAYSNETGERELQLLSTLSAVVLENFVLNMRILKMSNS